MGKVGQSVQLVAGETVRAAIITEVVDGERGTVNLTVFPPGGGAHGLQTVNHANYAAAGDAYWKSTK